jgi:hypothetical protein
MRGLHPELVEGITAGIICTTIIIGLAIFVAAQQPIQEVVTSEAKESDLIRAIYIDEYARNFVKYGMKFILESGIDNLFKRGGVMPTQATASGSKKWINVTSTGIKPVSYPVPKNESIPIELNDNVFYYRWCSNNTRPDTWDCDPIIISELTMDSDRKLMVIDSMQQAFSLTKYISQFSRFTQIYPEITSEGQVIDVTDTEVSATGEFRVVVRVGGFAGVNSSEVITSSAPTDVLKRIEAATTFVEVNGDLDLVLQSIDLCTGPGFTDPQYYLDLFNETLPTSVDTYDHWVNVTGTMEYDAYLNRRCLLLNNLHHLEPNNFQFRTQIYKCQDCLFTP